MRAPVRTSLAGSVAAIAAVVAALVFSASLGGLVSHPEEYGWNWTLLIQSQGGWGAWTPAAMNSLVSHQPGVTGWSEFGFSQLPIARAEPGAPVAEAATSPLVPVLGLVQHPGRAVEPPTTSGHPLAGEYQVEFGAVTMRRLGLHIGDQVRIWPDPHLFTVVGTVTVTVVPPEPGAVAVTVVVSVDGVTVVGAVAVVVVVAVAVSVTVGFGDVLLPVVDVTVASSAPSAW